MTSRIRILIVDDHALVRQGLSALIGVSTDMEVAGEAGDGEQAVRAARTVAPDVILLDLVMPRKDGITAIHEIMRDNPAARVLVLTSFVDDERVFAAIKAGALGYLLKDCLPAELVEAIHAVYRGEPSLSPAVAFKLVRELRQPASLPPTDAPLTGREAEVLELIAEGLSTDEIARKLEAETAAVTDLIGNIVCKVHLASRAQASLYTCRGDG